MALTLAAVALGVVAGLAAGGRPRNAGLRPVRALGALGAGILLQLAAGLGEVDGTPALTLLLTSYVLLAAFAVVNLRLVGMPVVLLGLGLNAAVIAANGAMPVRASAVLAADVVPAAELETADLGAKHRLERPGDRLTLLGDIIPVPPAREVVSFGDLILAVGLVDVVFRLLRPVAPKRRDDAEALDADVVVFPPATVRPGLRRSA